MNMNFHYKEHALHLWLATIASFNLADNKQLEKVKTYEVGDSEICSC